jgi:hypothetical protein
LKHISLSVGRENDVPQRRHRFKAQEVAHKTERIIEIIERIVARLIIIGLASVEGYKYVRWLLER